MKTTLYDFDWTETQGLWATDDKGEPTVLVEASTRELDTESDEYQEDPDYIEYGEPIAEYVLATSIEYTPGNGVITDNGKVIYGEAARKFIEARAKLSETCKAINLGE